MFAIRSLIQGLRIIPAVVVAIVLSLYVLSNAYEQRTVNLDVQPMEATP